MMNFSRTASIVAIGFILASGQFAQAARLLIVKIEHGGKVAQTSFYEDDGTADKRTVWSYLGGDPLAVEGGGTIDPSPDDPLTAKLVGPVGITVTHGKSALIEARFENLNLTRWRPDRDRWYLPPDEIQRVGLIAGLPMETASTPSSQQFWIGTLSIVMFLVMVFVVGFLLHRVRSVSS
jgi:hypothetical protein